MFNLRTIASALAIAVCLVAFQLQPATVAASETDGVIHFARNQLDKPFHLGSSGLRRYDCSGLVYRTFLENSLLKRIGGERTANSYYKWFKSQGRLTNSPRRGDLVVWAVKGHPVSHIGIFYGYNRYGQPMALSALTSGVAIHRVNGINKPLKAYLRVNLQR